MAVFPAKFIRLMIIQRIGYFGNRKENSYEKHGIFCGYLYWDIGNDGGL